MLADKIFEFSFDVDGKLIWAILILLLGISLLVDATKKNHKPLIIITGPSKKIDYNITEDSFTFNTSFGEQKQQVFLKTLRRGDINVSFGEYTVDLSRIENISSNCSIDSKCSFGELRLLVPKRYHVVTEISTVFAEVETSGSSDEQPAGIIHLNGNVSFGEIQIVYM